MVVPGDTDQFESFVAGNAQLVEELTEKAKAAGCTSHKFAVGEGQIVVVDEWGSADQFQAFIGSAEIQQVMGQMGASGEPVITVAAAKGFPGEF
jgi:heme-degrading monooxygenase HmoA